MTIKESIPNGVGEREAVEFSEQDLVRLDDGVYWVESKSRPGLWHQVHLDRDPHTCTCEAYTFETVEPERDDHIRRARLFEKRQRFLDALERPHVCYDGYVYVGHIVEGEAGEEVEVFERVLCERCAGVAR